jgi:two-component system, OmpR family, phosphate regulon sensor histidine kinase PhoR
VLFRRRPSLDEAVALVRSAVRRGALTPLEALGEPGANPAPVDAQELVDALPDPAAVLGKGSRISQLNSALDALLGPGRGHGRTLLEATRSADLAEAAREALSGKAWSREIELLALQKVVQATLAPLSGGRALLVFRDLTEPKRAESIRRDFIANASHELRTPVTAISGAVETLLGSGGLVEAPARRFVEMIARHAERLSRLANDLLDLSRLESGEYSLHLEPVSARAACEAALEAVRGRAQAKSIELSLEVDASLRALADRRALEQVLVNILDNAVKFTPERGRVGVEARAGSDAVVFAVTDSGPGIEPRHLPRIFERFYRADPGRSREAGGTGLGLAIARHLTEAQGGEISVESGQSGTRFTVRLRRAADE